MHDGLGQYAPLLPGPALPPAEPQEALPRQPGVGAPEADSVLPATGSPVDMLLVLAAVLLAAGGAIRLRFRRRYWASLR